MSQLLLPRMAAFRAVRTTLHYESLFNKLKKYVDRGHVITKRFSKGTKYMFSDGSFLVLDNGEVIEIGVSKKKMEHHLENNKDLSL